MNSQEELVVIKPKRRNKFSLIIALILLAALIYLRLQRAEQHPGDWYYQYSPVFLVILWLLGAVVFIFNRELSETVTLTLTRDGFRKGTRMFRWHDIERFGITTAYITLWSFIFPRKVIFWTYKQASSYIKLSQKITRILSGYDDVVFSNYEIETEELARLLNDWRMRYTGLPAEILNGTRWDRQISMKTFFMGVGTTIILIILITLFAFYLRN